MVATASAAAPPLYAGFWRRGAAMAVDMVITSAANAAAGVSLGPDVGAAILSIVMDCAYVALFTSSAKQATPGKMLFGIKVTDLDGERIGLLRAVARYFAGWLSGLLLMIGFAMAAFTRKKQALHDLITGTVVVRKTADPDEVVRGGGTMPLTFGVIVLAALIVALPPIAAAIAALVAPAYREQMARYAIANGMSELAPVKEDIAAALVAHRTVKAGPADVSKVHYLRDATVAPDGRITIRLKSSIAKNGSVVLTPGVDVNGTVSWTCRSPELADRYLPPGCRAPAKPAPSSPSSSSPPPSPPA